MSSILLLEPYAVDKDLKLFMDAVTNRAIIKDITENFGFEEHVTLKVKNMVSLSSGEGSQGQFSEQDVNPSRLLYQECLQNHPPAS
ncbi:hypothetical protein BC941DRAFT_465105 [Chlamydoabsidia padenii]|nr:hypothetical protein BC941DRAFT_465105 [Chlamydoabsidia padenii]